MVGPEPFQLLPEDLFGTCQAADHVLRQFRRHIHLFPDSVSLHHRPQERFAARVDIRRVKVVHACPVRGQDLRFRLFQVNRVSLFRESHASESQDGQFVPVFVPAVLHFASSL